MTDTSELKTVPVVTWIPDPIQKDDEKYRCTIDGIQYIRSCRKLKVPRVKKIKPPRVLKIRPVPLSIEERRDARKKYMVTYRREKKEKMKELKKEIQRLTVATIETSAVDAALT
jgi:hypothetical protein